MAGSGRSPEKSKKPFCSSGYLEVGCVQCIPCQATSIGSQSHLPSSALADLGSGDIQLLPMPAVPLTPLPLGLALPPAAHVPVSDPLAEGAKELPRASTLGQPAQPVGPVLLGEAPALLGREEAGAPLPELPAARAESCAAKPVPPKGEDGRPATREKINVLLATPVCYFGQIGTAKREREGLQHEKGSV